MTSAEWASPSYFTAPDEKNPQIFSRSSVSLAERASIALLTVCTTHIIGKPHYSLLSMMKKWRLLHPLQ
ncbi:hypothetical protein BHE74_00010890 [Ensete ventricosum]|uniref:Uncharacterized protein n=1 Tax=Ensete ventricosum TaxID=4639 RepID=A0A426YTE8_ENSVE|nr:hypothetical protein B296_00014380 [Ensete ventricosum]RWW80753.1 hypothetical protein BHE74_00010890 [Ensete ventricosum]